VLFGIMNLGAGAGAVMDARARARVMAQLCDERCGFCHGDADGRVWLWRFGMDALTAEMGTPSGPGVELSMCFGLPFARLRAAMPDEVRTPRPAAAARCVCVVLHRGSVALCLMHRHARADGARSGSPAPLWTRSGGATASAPPACATPRRCTRTC
jgi:hypothetical protein